VKVPIRAKINGAWKQAILTTEHSSSDMPVVVVKGEDCARDANEVDEIAVPAQHKDVAERGRYQIAQTTTRYHDNDMPHELHLQATIAAKMAGKSLKAWVREALREKLSRTRAS
jgi:hypothetical protein